MMTSEINEFGISNYRSLVKTAVGKFRQVRYDSKDVQRSVIWRHDCDFSLDQAVKIGKIDQEERMTSTFFVNIHANTYNAMSASGQNRVRELIGLNREIGIHLDSFFYGGIQSPNQLTDILGQEQKLYKEFFGVEPRAFSFHNPTDEETQFQDETYAGLVNCYSKKFRNDWRYVSDSNGYWRHKSISEVLEEESTVPLQVLTHAEWWSEKALQPRERLSATLLLSTFQLLKEYDQDVAEFDRQNISAIESIIRHVGPSDVELHLLLTAMYSLLTADTYASNHDRDYPFQIQMNTLIDKMLSLKLIQTSMIT
jgi:hypothetical protein